MCSIKSFTTVSNDDCRGVEICARDVVHVLSVHLIVLCSVSPQCHGRFGHMRVTAKTEASALGSLPDLCSLEQNSVRRGRGLGEPELVSH